MPLINRLEKHYLDLSSVLQGWQKNVIFHSDACASVVLQAVKRQGPGDLMEEMYHRVSEEAKLILLYCATPDAVVQLSTSILGSFVAQVLSHKYWNKQQHHSFADFLQAHLYNVDLERHAIFTETLDVFAAMTCAEILTRDKRHPKAKSPGLDAAGKEAVHTTGACLLRLVLSRQQEHSQSSHRKGQ
ncbi:Hypothetical predicted protein, partial [Marmota monax]